MAWCRFALGTFFLTCSVYSLVFRPDGTQLIATSGNRVVVRHAGPRVKATL
jgi:hypothetical protein